MENRTKIHQIGVGFSCYFKMVETRHIGSRFHLEALHGLAGLGDHQIVAVVAGHWFTSPFLWIEQNIRLFAPIFAHGKEDIQKMKM